MEANKLMKVAAGLTEAEKKHTVLGTKAEARLGENEAEVDSPEVEKREADNEKADEKSLMSGGEAEKKASTGFQSFQSFEGGRQ